MQQWTWNTLSARSAVTDTLNSLLSVLNLKMKALEGFLKNSAALLTGTGTLAVNAATPKIGTAKVWTTANTVATNITAFQNGAKGQEIILIFNDANTTLVNGANLKLKGAVNFVGAVGNTKLLVTADGVIWREVPQ